MNNFPKAVQEELKSYVYIYIDPRNEEIFYVGKGKNNRCFSHLADKNESKKVDRINEIKREGKEPKIEIVIHGLNDEQSFNVESSIIDLLDIDKLTNQVKGHHSSLTGRMSIEKIIAKYQPEKANITEPALLIKISKTFYYAMPANEMYDSTRQFWRIGENKSKVKYAFAIFDGVIQEVYEIQNWYEAGTTFSSRTYNKTKGKRWEFVGNVASQDIRNKHLYKDVSDLTKYQSPIYYLNINGAENEKEELEKNIDDTN